MNEEDVVDRLVNDWRRERPDLDPAAMHIVGRAIMLGKALERRANHVLLPRGLIYTDLDVLATLRRSGAPYCLSPKELMESVLITSGSMTALLNRLTKLELVARVKDKNDGRIKRARLTKKGIALIDKAIEDRFEEAADAVHELPTGDQETLAAMLRRLLKTVE